MEKTQEELNALKEEVVTMNEKLHELTEEELAQVTGGDDVTDGISRQPEPVYEGAGKVRVR